MKGAHGVYLNVKYWSPRVLIDSTSVPAIEINANLHLTLEMEMLKVKNKCDNQLFKAYMNLKFVISFPTMDQIRKFAFQLETGNVKGQRQGSQLKVLIKVYMHYACEF